MRPKGVILSGGPASVLDAGAPLAPASIYRAGVPVLGICYGEQAMAQQLGGVVEAGHHREFGRAEVLVTEDTPLFEGVWRKGERYPVWMSHGDRVTGPPAGFRVVGTSPNAPIAMIADEARKFYATQFHLEVVHTPHGAALIRNFVRKIAGCKGDWTMRAFKQEAVEKIRAQVRKGRVICGLSGGVDSAVAAVLIPEVLGRVESPGGPSVTLKSHHHVGGFPERMNMKRFEPLRELFKDEVRALGRELGLPDAFVGRHPFPGPGLAIRSPGDITREKHDILRRADDIYIEEIRRAGLYDDIWQAFAVLLPVRTVGVMGDYRTYDYVVGLRAVTSSDGMTADFYPCDMKCIAHVAPRLVDEVKGVHRRVYHVA